MKKTLLTLGTIGTIVAPIAAIVSCGDKQEKAIEGQHHIPDEIKNLQVKEDGLYVAKSTYSGSFWNGTSHEGSYDHSDYIKIDSERLNNKVLEFGDGDSFYFVFDNDNNDGINIRHFRDELFLNDTSISVQARIRALNRHLGVKEINGQSAPGFKQTDSSHGAMQTWIGSQSNHMGDVTITDALDSMKEKLEPNQFANIADYYGFRTTKDSNGNYEKSSSQGANAQFKPVLPKDGLFTYEIENDHVVKITFHNQENIRITAAGFFIKHYNSDEVKSVYTFSLGDKKEWSAYENGSINNVPYNLIGRKKDFVAPSDQIDSKEYIDVQIAKDNKVLKDIHLSLFEEEKLNLTEFYNKLKTYLDANGEKYQYTLNYSIKHPGAGREVLSPGVLQKINDNTQKYCVPKGILSDEIVNFDLETFRTISLTENQWTQTAQFLKGLHVDVSNLEHNGESLFNLLNNEDNINKVLNHFLSRIQPNYELNLYNDSRHIDYATNQSKFSSRAREEFKNGNTLIFKLR